MCLPSDSDNRPVELEKGEKKGDDSDRAGNKKDSKKFRDQREREREEEEEEEEKEEEKKKI